MKLLLIFSYKFNSTLSILRVNENDYHKEFKCFSKNSLGLASISYFIYSPKTIFNVPKDGDMPIEAGELVPEKESYDSLCPESPPCEKCPSPK
jgi:hypothetical protein